jgi:hypothetical protein
MFPEPNCDAIAILSGVKVLLKIDLSFSDDVQLKIPVFYFKRSRVLGPNSAGKKKVFSKLFTTQVLDIVQN